MNILLITTHLNYGGITSYIKSLAKGLKYRGHNVSVASSGGDCLEYLRNLGIEHILIPIKTKSEISPKLFLSFFKLLPILKEKNIQIIHSNTRVTQVLGFLLSKFTGIPYISTCHGFFKSRIFRRLFGCWGDIVIAISGSVKKHLREDFRIKEEDIRLIYHGIEKLKIKNEKLKMKNQLGLSEERIIGIVARLSEVKGHKFLIEAMSYVLKEMPSVQLFIVGEGKEKENLLRQIERLNIKDNIRFFPSMGDITDILFLMDVFVAPSLKEGFGLSLLEALRCGIPVVAFKVGGIVDLIEDKKTGLLVEKGDVKGLALAILKLLKDKELARYLGENGKRFVEMNFSLEKMIKETEALYRYVCQKISH